MSTLRAFLSTVTLWCLLVCTVYFHSYSSVQHQLQYQLQQWLSSYASAVQLAGWQTQPKLAEHIEQSLIAHVNEQLVEQSSLWLKSFTVIDLQLDVRAVGDGYLSFNWQYDQKNIIGALTFELNYHWLLLISVSLLVALLSVTSAELLSLILSVDRLAFAMYLKASDGSVWKACISTIFSSARYLEQSENLVFFPESSEVEIHGQRIVMSKTPFFYYLWYAQRRTVDLRGGWFLNPAADKHDEREASKLIEVMELYGGHVKAINELKKNGLKAKTLDQNRNKIKDELSKHLPESHLQNYLFESKRDPRTARYAHRLMLEKDKIVIGIN